jgi:fructoselysine-6-P-deglycase FrlB-like protein
MSELHPERFTEDILETPSALRATADLHAAGGPLARLGSLEPRPRRVLFLGMGSSRFAAMIVAALLRSRGVDAAVEHASSGLVQPPGPDTLVLAVSAGGHSAETLAAMRRHRGRSHVVAVTNRPRRPIGVEADLCLGLAAGEEVSGVASKTYACTLAVLLLTAGRFLGEPALGRSLVRTAADACERVLDGRDLWLEQAADLLGERAVHVLAPAERIGSAEQSALMLREVPRIRADACETGDWSHVDVYLTKRPGTGLLLLRGSAWEDEVLEWATTRGTPVVTAGGELPDAAMDVHLHDGGDPLVRALVEVLVAQLLAAELWRREPI